MEETQLFLSPSLSSAREPPPPPDSSFCISLTKQSSGGLRGTRAGSQERVRWNRGREPGPPHLLWKTGAPCFQPSSDLLSLPAFFPVTRKGRIQGIGVRGDLGATLGAPGRGGGARPAARQHLGPGQGPGRGLTCAGPGRWVRRRRADDNRFASGEPDEF